MGSKNAGYLEKHIEGEPSGPPSICNECGYVLLLASRNDVDDLAAAAGNKVDTYRMSEILINELRSGTLGRISLETPEMREAEEAIVAEQRIADEERKAAKLEEKHQRKLRARKNRK